jgi:hypothetical protein
LPDAARPAEAPDPIELARRCFADGPQYLPAAHELARWTGRRLVIRPVPVPFPVTRERS